MRRTRNLLMIDARGTGRSSLIDCPALQHHAYPAYGRKFERLVGDCGKGLNHRWKAPDGSWIHASDLFSTGYAVDDTAAVLRALGLPKVDLYGDSYGTWFAQSFITRHPELLRSVVLDSAYPLLGSSPWFPASFTTARRAFRLVCERDPACRTQLPGDPWDLIKALVAQVRATPVQGWSHDPGSGRAVPVKVDARVMVDLVANAGFDIKVYRELLAAAEAALGGDKVPLLRLGALAAHVDNLPPRRPSWYSDGLYFAAACTDYDQLFPMNVSPAKRRAKLAQAIAAQPDRYRPFTPGEWVQMDNYSEAFTGCLDWPKPLAAHRHPASGHGQPIAPRRLPVMVLGGDLDSWTPASLAPTVLKQLGDGRGRSVRFVPLANSVHTPGEIGTNPNAASTRCASTLVRRFFARPGRLAQMDVSCGPKIPPVHTPGTFPKLLTLAAPATVVEGSASPAERQVATVAVQALGDAVSSWFVADGKRGPALRGGTFRGVGGNRVRFTLKDARWVKDATVNGTGVWGTQSGRVSGRLVVDGPDGLKRRFALRWSQNRPRASVVMLGAGGAELAQLRLPAP
jgi:pimeloyl-ACP methyl ester carboxylesterase